MRILLTLAAVGLIASSTAAEVVGRIDNLIIVKTDKGYEIKVPGQSVKQSSVPKQTVKVTKRKFPVREVKVKEKHGKLDLYYDVIRALENGAGEPVYSRIKGFNIERILDRGNYFGAVISGNVNEKLLHKAFELVKQGMTFRDAYRKIGSNIKDIKISPEEIREMLKQSTHQGGTGNLQLDKLAEQIQAMR